MSRNSFIISALGIRRRSGIMEWNIADITPRPKPCERGVGVILCGGHRRCLIYILNLTGDDLGLIRASRFSRLLLFNFCRGRCTVDVAVLRFFFLASFSGCRWFSFSDTGGNLLCSFIFD